LRFAIVTTKVPGLTRWQIHKADCPDVAKWIQKGGSVAIVSSQSAEKLIHEEIIVRENEVVTADDFQIMPCCRSSG
jgi:hypothetical protein